jgi:hypothetical protein
MATINITPGYGWSSGEIVTPAKMNLAAAPTAALAPNTVVNADIKSDAAIAGSKIAPNFGEQNITVSGGVRSITNTTNHALAFGTNNTERMRIDSNGSLLVNATAAWTNIVQSNSIYLTRAAAASLFIRRETGNGNVVGFYQGADTQVGSISVTTTATAYNTSSDHRLKQNVEPMVGGLAKLAALSPKTFEFKAEPNVKVDGFIAHEVQAVVPQAVNGEKDGEEMQGLDMSKLVPVLVAAVQELSAKVAALEAAQTEDK